jgi:hypothetical protein
VSWILRLVKTGTEGDGQATDVMEIDRPDDLRDIATLGLTLSEAKQLLSVLQQRIVAAQAKTHAGIWHNLSPPLTRAHRLLNRGGHAMAS